LQDQVHRRKTLILKSALSQSQTTFVSDENVANNQPDTDEKNNKIGNNQDVDQTDENNNSLILQTPTSVKGNKKSPTIHEYFSSITSLHGHDEVIAKEKTIQSQREYLQNLENNRVTKRRTERAMEVAESLKSRTQHLEDVQQFTDEFKKEKEEILNKIHQLQTKLQLLRQDIPDEKAKRLKRLVDISSVEDDLNNLTQKYAQLSSNLTNETINEDDKEDDEINFEENIGKALDVGLALRTSVTKQD